MRLYTTPYTKSIHNDEQVCSKHAGKVKSNQTTYSWKTPPLSFCVAVTVTYYVVLTDSETQSM